MVIVWDISTRKPLHKLKGHTKSLQDLAIDPFSVPEDSSEPGEDLVLFTASSDREIRRWHISVDSAYETSASLSSPILAHETSIYKLHFDSSGDLWTASADKTAKHLVRDRNWEADTVLPHPDFVRDVVVADRAGVVITACRDEEVRAWGLASGKLVCTYTGHWEDVTGLVLLSNELEVASVGIDATVRRWGLRGKDFESYRERLASSAAGEDVAVNGAKVDAGGGTGLLTADEEAELADLMDDSD